MRQVNPNEIFKGEYQKLCFGMIKTTHDFFQWHIKHSQLFETSHSTPIITMHIIKITSNMACQSLSHSLNKLPILLL